MKKIPKNLTDTVITIILMTEIRIMDKSQKRHFS